MENESRSERREMTRTAKLAAFALVLVLCFAVGAGIGAVVGPIDGGMRHDGH
jgi:hypothetical protein